MAGSLVVVAGGPPNEKGEAFESSEDPKVDFAPNENAGAVADNDASLEVFGAKEKADDAGTAAAVSLEDFGAKEKADDAGVAVAESLGFDANENGDGVVEGCTPKVGAEPKENADCGFASCCSGLVLGDNPKE